MTVEQKNWIDNASYYELLKRWRFANNEDTIFHGSTGAYYNSIMKKCGLELSDIECVKISKLIGWEK